MVLHQETYLHFITAIATPNFIITGMPLFGGGLPAVNKFCSTLDRLLDAFAFWP
jgi:hypothetical protein